MRTDLVGQLADVPGLDIRSMDSKDLCELLSYGNSNLNVVENRMIIEATTSFIHFHFHIFMHRKIPFS